MNKSVIHFSNGERLTLHEGQLIVPYRISRSDEGDFVSMHPTYEVWNHAHDGLTPSITELLCTCEYFRPLEVSNKIYKTSAVVSVENL